MNFFGTWSSAVSYPIGAAIYENGSSYVALLANLADDPAGSVSSSDGNWALLAAVGATGAIGDTGAAGPTGVAGPTGDVGPVGPAGATGDVGPAGPVGAIGPIGVTGDVGPAGSIGPAGPIGPTGAIGPTGTTSESSCPPGTGPNVSPPVAVSPAGSHSLLCVYYDNYASSPISANQASDACVSDVGGQLCSYDQIRRACSSGSLSLMGSGAGNGTWLRDRISATFSLTVASTNCNSFAGNSSTTEAAAYCCLEWMAY